MRSPTSLLSTLVTANHILHHHKVIDALGHISVRSPANPSTFFLSGNVPPSLVSGLSDLVEYKVKDASATKSDAPRGYAERFIHSEIYKRYPDVKSVVHGRPEAIIPFSVSSLPLRPVYHAAGVIGSVIPVFDIRHGHPNVPHNILVTNEDKGAGLAASFDPTSLVSKTNTIINDHFSISHSGPVTYPPLTTILMRGHGFTSVGTSIEEAVYRSIYLCSNARIQTASMILQNADNAINARAKGMESVPPGQMDDIKYLTERECKDSWVEGDKSQIDGPWKLWCAEVERTGLYRNTLSWSPSM